MSDSDFDFDFALPTDTRKKNQIPWEDFPPPRFDKETKRHIYASKRLLPDDTVDEEGKPIDTVGKLKNRVDQSFRNYTKKFKDDKGDPLLDENGNEVLIPKFIARIVLEDEVSVVRVWREE